MPAGMARTTVRSRHLVGSAGRRVERALSRASFSLTATPEGRARWRRRRGQTDCDVEMSRAESSHALSKDSAGPSARGRSGRVPVVLEPLAVSSLLLFLSYQGLGAKELHERRWFLVDRRGVGLSPRPSACTTTPVSPSTPAGTRR